jgi:hypothetical protein
LQDAATLEDFAEHTGQAPHLYVWEINYFPERSQHLLTLPECQSLINLIWVDQLHLQGDPPVVHDGRGSRCARTFESRIYLPRWARNPMVVIHELAHCVTDLFDSDDSQAHGPRYMKVYLSLWAINSSYKYPALRKHANRNGLRVSPIDMMKKLKGFQRWN